MAACFDIGGSFIKFGVSDPSGYVKESGRLVNPVQSFDEFVAALQKALAAMGNNLKQLSISLAGIFDPRSGLAIVANVPCLNGRRVQADLADALDADIRITNDADCFALAEVHSGVAKGKSSVFGIILGTGVGGGVVINGQLLQGFGGISGEWGHGPITDPTAGGMIEALPRAECGCGRVDCLDSSGSSRGMERIHLARTGAAMTSNSITSGWKSGDAACSETIAIFVECIARPLGVVINTLGCDLVPVGGGLASEPALIARIDARVRQHVLAAHPDPLVVPGLYVNDGGLKGAAIVALQSSFQ